LERIGEVAVAVSGGVDSMTLALVAHDTLASRARMFHAISPAVPPDATRRVTTYARRHGWRLDVIDAGEVSDEHYLGNPVNRCFFCKTHLYDAMAALTDAVLVSGTNLDDLGDYRPGLRAAADHGVRHPYVEARIDKAGVRAIARSLGYEELAALPAAPCLSSRIESGVRIDPAVLTVVDAVEKLLREALQPRTVRCRVRRAVIGIELDGEALARLSTIGRQAWCDRIRTMFHSTGLDRPVTFEPYRMGSAFLR
jgi:uncharacterized protein